jgi:hypothetical protein
VREIAPPRPSGSHARWRKKPVSSPLATPGVHGGCAARAQPDHGGRDVRHLRGGRCTLTNLFAGTSLTGAFADRFVTLAAQEEGCGKLLFRIQTRLAPDGREPRTGCR